MIPRRRAGLIPLSLVGAVVALLLAAPSAVALPSGPVPGSPPRRPQLRYHPQACAVAVPDAPGGAIRCGAVIVPADYDKPAAGRVELAVATIPAALDTGRPPLVVLAGGPGEKLVAPLLAGLAELLADPTALPVGFVMLAETRDVVFVDQRGVGLSRPALDCPEVADALAHATTETIRADTVIGFRLCRDRLVGAGVDLSLFNTANNARDIDAVRQALGYPKMDLFGTSYGARLALQVARDHSDGLSHLILSSAIPAEENFIADVGRSYDWALRVLDHACSIDEACDAMIPHLLATFEGVLRDLQAEPAVVMVPEPGAGVTVPVAIDAFSFDSVIYSLFYSPVGPGFIPAIIAAAAQGDFSALVSSVPIGPAASPVSLGMQASFLCAEEAARTSPSAQHPGDTLAAQLITANNPIIGAGLADVCAAWDVAPAPAEIFAPITSDVPTLIFAGWFDQITPPSYALAVEQALPKDIYVSVPAVGHSPLFGSGQCGLSVLDQFISADWWAVDHSCAGQPPAFHINEGAGSVAAPA